MEKIFDMVLPVLIDIFELMGILILTYGTVQAFYNFLLEIFKNKKVDVKYTFANRMITSLDFKLAAEILKTVIVKTPEEIFLMSAVFLIRIAMTFVLERGIKLEYAIKNHTLKEN